MTRRSNLWLLGASLFTFINIAGAGFALAAGELLHTAVHVVLVPVGAYFMWWRVSRTRRDQLPDAQLADARLDQLQQAVDAIALDVERVGEAQRYIAKLAAERAEKHEL